jgi:hypothetical protein
MHTCPGPDEDNGPYTVAAVWGQHSGVISGDAFGGALPPDPTATVDWHFERVGATFPPPTVCIGAPVDTFTGLHRSVDVQYDVVANVTWTRTSTTGCIDAYTPSGTASITGTTTTCATTLMVSPSAGTVGAADGSMTIDRSTNPPTFSIDGQSRWMATTTCTNADGTVTTQQTTAGNDWGSRGPLTQPVTAGRVQRWYYDRSWRLSP